MRTERDMLDLIVGTAQADDRIRAAMLNGSRVDPDATRDLFQDYDVAFFVTDVDTFVRDSAWIDRFGERTILQMPEAMGDPPPMKDGHFGYLMQFTDGNRIDLTLFPIGRLREFHLESLSAMLLDKDGLFGPLPPPSRRDFLPTPPSDARFADCCNEFWWMATYVAKGLWRGQVTYAKNMDEIVREQLMTMLDWSIGMRTQFAAGAGKFGRDLQRHLTPAQWDRLLATYADADPGRSWDALFVMCDLFRETATAVAGHFGFAYPHGDDARVTAYLRRVRALPAEAADM